MAAPRRGSAPFFAPSPTLSLSLSPQDHPTPTGGHLSRRSRRRFAFSPARPDGSTPRRAEPVAMQAGKAAESREGGRPLQLTMKRGYEVLRDPHLNKVGAGASPLPSAACLRAVPGASPSMEPAAGLCRSLGSPFLSSYCSTRMLVGFHVRVCYFAASCSVSRPPIHSALLCFLGQCVRPPRVPESFCHGVSAAKSNARSP